MTIEKTLSSWWKRIIIFIFLTITIKITLFYIQLLLISIIEIDLLFNVPELQWFLSLLSSSFIIEYLRPGNKSYLFGLMINKKVIIDVLTSLIITIFPFTLLILSLIIFKIKVSLAIIDSYYMIFFSFYLFIAAFMEELIFRGIIFQALLSRFGVLFSLTIMSLIFSIIHANNPDFSILAFFNTILGGLLLGIMYIQTRSLFLPVTFHFFWNLTLAFINSPVSGFDWRISILVIDWLNLPECLFGSYYGLEGGLIATIILVSSIFIVLKYSASSPFVDSKIYLRDIQESNFL